jgi:hypothetical protein
MEHFRSASATPHRLHTARLHACTPALLSARSSSSLYLLFLIPFYRYTWAKSPATSHSFEFPPCHPPLPHWASCHTPPTWFPCSRSNEIVCSSSRTSYATLTKDAVILNTIRQTTRGDVRLTLPLRLASLMLRLVEGPHSRRRQPEAHKQCRQGR